MIGLLVSGSVLGLAWFAALNLLLSAMVWVMLRVGRVHERGLGWPALLALRLLPATGAGLLAAGLFVPAHWIYEPRNVEESYAATVWLLAAIGAVLIIAAAARGLSAAWTSRRVGQAWRSLASSQAGIVEIDGLPNLALAGILRPTLCVGRPVRRVLTAAELSVALDHERAHLGRHDNLKRFAMWAAPDALAFTREARRLEDAWAAQAECAADAEAVRGDGARAVDLASALVKVARLCDAAGVRAGTAAWSTLHEPSLLDLRVRRLVTGPVPAVPDSRMAVSTWVAGLAAAPLAAWWLGGFAAIHLATERLIRLLP